MLKCPTLQQKKNVYRLVQKGILVYIANFDLRYNCEFFFYNYTLYTKYTKP